MGERKRLKLLFLASILAVLSSCAPVRDFRFEGYNLRPKGRIGRNASATILTSFVGKDVGKHTYYLNVREKNGIAYTCRAGHIDLAHVRKTVDWTAYLAAKVNRHLQQTETEFTFIANEPARYYLSIAYPPDWDDRSESARKATTKDVAIELGAYLAYVSATLHEIFTWYNFNITMFFSEHSSAFSWEDNTSNLLGSMIGKKALKQGGPFSRTATLILNEELALLKIQPKSVAEQASEAKEGQWYTGEYFLKDMIYRHFDIGTDGTVESCLVDMPECRGCIPVIFPAPNLDHIQRQGFQVEIKIKPYIARDRFMLAAYPNDDTKHTRITPEHFEPILEAIIQEADKKGFAYVE
jgi:hypothetical protein